MNKKKEEYILAKKVAAEDKKEIHKTGGGPYRAQLDEAGAQLLAVVADQIEPLPNPYDDAAIYFADTVDYDVVHVHEEPIHFLPHPEPQIQTEPEPEPILVAVIAILTIPQHVLVQSELCEVTAVTSPTATREQFYDSYYGYYRNKDVYTTLYRYAKCSNVKYETGFELKISDSENLKYLIFENSSMSLIAVHIFSSFTDIKQLYLNSSEVETIQPGAFTGLSQLQELYLDDNCIKKLSAGIFNSLTQLKLLNLHNNRIEAIEEHTLLGVINLQTINLRNNNISNIPLSTFENLHKLEYVDLSQNNFDVISPEMFDTNKLLNLTLSYNNISDIDFAVLPATLQTLNLSNNILYNVHNISKLINLEQLDVSLNKITQIIIFDELSYVNQTQNLKTLDVAHNNLTILSADTFQSLFSLTVLNLQHNMLSEIPIGCFSDLHSLISLNLSSNKLKIVDHGTFSDLNKLKVLDISSNYLNTIYESAFYPLKNLKILNIADNILISIDAIHLIEHCANLSIVTLDNNPWDCKSLGKIIKSFEKRHILVTKGPTQKSLHINGISCNNYNKELTTKSDTFLDDSIPSSQSQLTNLTFSKFSGYFDTLSEAFNKTFETFTKQFQLLDDIFKNSSLYKFPNYDKLNRGFQNTSFYKFFTRDFNKTEFFNYTSRLNFTFPKIESERNYMKFVPNYSQALTQHSFIPGNGKEPNNNSSESLVSLKNEISVFMTLIAIMLFVIIILITLIYIGLRLNLNKFINLKNANDNLPQLDAEMQLI